MTNTDDSGQGLTTAAKAKLGGAAVVITIAVIFIVENGRKTKIRFLGPEVRTYLWLALLVAFALGMAGGLLIAWRRGRR